MGRRSNLTMSRRDVLRHGSAAAALAMIGRVALPSSVVTANAAASDGPYGPLLPVDGNGLQLPAGFTSRFVARTGDLVVGTGFRWHADPDGGACFPTDDGYVYVANSEVANRQGGVGAIAFDHAGNVLDAYSILSGTNRNCSGGATPWGTWLSCEENGSNSLIYECDPLGVRAAKSRPSMGRFNHEAVVPVLATGSLAPSLIMTEDDPNGRLYRFVPDTWGTLTRGRLQAASVAVDGTVSWVGVSTNGPDRSSSTTRFNGGEGLAVHGTDVFIATKGDRRLRRLDMATSTIEVIHDCNLAPDTVLDSVDGLLIDQPTGDLFVAEDGSTADVALVSATTAGPLEISPFVRFIGHEGSEVTGLAINPERTTMLVSSQRGTDGRGLTFAVTGPFRTPGQPPVTTTTTTTAPPDATTTTTTNAPPEATTTTTFPAEPTPTTGSTTTTTPTTAGPGTTAPVATTTPNTTVPPGPVGSGLDRPTSTSKLRRATRLSNG